MKARTFKGEMMYNPHPKGSCNVFFAIEQGTTKIQIRRP